LAAAGPDTSIVTRSSRRNAWADAGFVRAIEAAGRRRLVMGGLWTEVALTLTALSTLEAGYEVYVVVDVAGGTSRGRHDAAVRRMVQAGAVPVTWLQVNHECLDAMDTPQTRVAVREIEAAHADPAPRS
jgi:nicotinamidase-related amidase